MSCIYIYIYIERERERYTPQAFERARRGKRVREVQEASAAKQTEASPMTEA